MVNAEASDGVKRLVRAHTSEKQPTAKSAAGNGAENVKTPRRRNPATMSPQLSERAKKLALKAFQMTYDAHHGKNS